MTGLPSLLDISHTDSGPESPLAIALSTLLEPTPILIDALVPQVAQSLKSTETTLSSYAQLVDFASDVVMTWDDTRKAQFIHGHPRIGEVKKLSALSAKEQGQSTTAATVVTPPEVLKRLQVLNACYERRYPGLVYITFVNGRSRAQIRDEMEEKLVSEGVILDKDKLDDIQSRDTSDPGWKAELERALVDVGKIAKSRITNMGLQ